MIDSLIFGQGKLSSQKERLSSPGLADDQSGSNRMLPPALDVSMSHFGTAPDRNERPFIPEDRENGLVWLSRRPGWCPEGRMQTSQEHPRTFAAADGVSISKTTEGGHHHRVPGLPEAPLPLPDPRGLVTHGNQLVTSLSF